MHTFDFSTICRHVDSETTSTPCKIEGVLPSWLNGFMIYNGPGRTKFGKHVYKHVFDGSALLQKISIKNGSVFYETKFLKTRTYKKNTEVNEITVAEFGTPASVNRGMLSKLVSLMDLDKMVSDNAMSTVVKIGPHYYAIGETPFLFQIDPTTLDVIKKINTNKLFGFGSQSPHIYEDSNGYYMVGQVVGVTGSKYSIIRCPTNGDITKGQCVASIPCRWRTCPCYVHSIAMTENYVVLIEVPLSVSLMELLSDVLSNRPFFDGLQWREEQAIFHILDRKTWKPVTTKYISNGFFFVHFGNVYEYKDQLVITLCSFKDSHMLQSMFIDKLRNSAEEFTEKDYAAFYSNLVRYVIPLNVEQSSEGIELVNLPGSTASAELVDNEVKLKREVLSDLCIEDPVVNPKYEKAGARFIWGMGNGPNRANYCHILKMDLETKQVKTFYEANTYVSMPSFVPSPDAEEEDEGVIICSAQSGKDERLFTFLVLDASSLKEVARATAQIKTRVPFPSHGHFFSS